MAKKRIPKKIRSEIDDYLNRLEEISLTAVFLFGSQAKGTARKWSDIDICVISPDFGKMDSWKYLWDKKADFNAKYVQPIGFAPQDFVDENPLVHEIKNHGIKLR